MASNGEGQDNTADDTITRSMENMLRRAQVLNGALTALMQDLSTANPLLSFPVMQSRINYIQSELNECKIAMDQNMDVLANVVLVPTQSFPTRYHSFVLEHLFRTKLEPNVEEWQRQALKTAAEKENRQDREKRDGRMTTLSEEDRHELWSEAALVADAEVRKYAWFNGDYTLAEVENGIENVRHGLKRELKVPDLDTGDDDEDEFELEDVQEDAMEVDQTDAKQKPTSNAAESEDSPTNAMPIDNLLRFMTKGQL